MRPDTDCQWGASTELCMLVFSFGGGGGGGGGKAFFIQVPPSVRPSFIMRGSFQFAENTCELSGLKREEERERVFVLRVCARACVL